MKHLLLSIALLFPMFTVAQQTDEASECPDHITKVLDLQDVDVMGTRPHYVRLKGYYRSYQWNDSVLKYYKDGIVEYFVDLKRNRSDNNVHVSRCMRNSQLVGKDRKRAFTYSDDQTGKPWFEDKTYIEKCREEYLLKDSLGRQFLLFHGQTIGDITADSTAGKCLLRINPLPTYTINAEDYYSYKDLLYNKSDDTSLYWFKKDTHKQLIHVITELYITEKEYVSKKFPANHCKCHQRKRRKLSPLSVMTTRSRHCPYQQDWNSSHSTITILQRSRT